MGEQYDLGVIRMICERADYIQQHPANLTFGSGIAIMHSQFFALRNEAREFSSSLLISNTAQVRVYRSAQVPTPPVCDSTQRVRSTSSPICFL